MNSDQAYDVLMMIRMKRGAEKANTLRHYPEVIPLLKYALNPYITYGVTAQKHEGKGEAHFKACGVREILNRLASREFSGRRALDVIEAAQNKMTRKSAKLFDMILDKNLRIGVQAKTVNKIWPGCIPTHDVMLAQKFDPARVKFPCRVEPKLDGLRATYIDGELYTRKGLKLLGLEKVKKELENLPESEWDGELEVPGCTFQKASGLLRSDAEVPEAVFTIFEARDAIFNRYNDQEHVKFILTEICHTLNEVYGYYAKYREEGREGAMVKSFSYEYQGKRSWDWMKLKPLEDGEFIVTDTYEGEGKYEGMLGGVVVDFKGKLNRVGGGFTDAQRQEFWESDDIIGQSVTVEYMEETDDGNMRHSRFKGIRWDK